MSHGGDGELPEEHEEHENHEAWVIPYADLLTLLMAMFIALFAMSTVDSSKFKRLAIGFNEALGGGKLDSGIGGSGKATSPLVGSGQGTGPLSGSTLMPSPEAVTDAQLAQIMQTLATGKAAAGEQRASLEEVERRIKEAAKSLGLGGKVETKQLNNGLEVTVLTDKVLFTSGHAELQPGGLELLSLIANVLQTVDNPIVINGYTDIRPIHTLEFPSNRRLSSARAGAVADYFEFIGINAERLLPTGLGATHFVGDNATDEGRAKNRRVEIIVQSKLVKQVQDEAGLNSDPASTTPTSKPISAPAQPGVNGVNPGLKNPVLGAGG